LNVYSKYSDDQLVMLLKQSDDQAFTEIYYRYWKLLISIAANKLPSVTDAEEIVQEVFADLWKRRSEIVIDHSIKSFLAAAAKYQIYSAMARLNKQRTVGEININASVSINEEIESRSLFNELFDHASRLPERCFLIYKLSRVDGLTNKEISSSLGIAEKTIEAQITRALRHLRAAIHVMALIQIIFLFF
jgi:RNA polymerase sigma factor (sigma-70 family)